MANHRAKADVVTFKVDASLMDAMKGIPNRSEFIRCAILNALASLCPVCRGTGVLTPNQKKHWQSFSANHILEECGDCHELHLVCERSQTGSCADEEPAASR